MRGVFLLSPGATSDSTSVIHGTQAAGILQFSSLILSTQNFYFLKINPFRCNCGRSESPCTQIQIGPSFSFSFERFSCNHGFPGYLEQHSGARWFWGSREFFLSPQFSCARPPFIMIQFVSIILLQISISSSSISGVWYWLGISVCVYLLNVLLLFYFSLEFMSSISFEGRFFLLHEVFPHTQIILPCGFPLLQQPSFLSWSGPP